MAQSQQTVGGMQGTGLGATIGLAAGAGGGPVGAIIGAAVGLAVGTVSGIVNIFNTQSEIRDAKRQLKNETALALWQQEEAFKLAKKEAYENARKADEQTTFQEQNLSGVYSDKIEQLGLAELMQTYSENSTLMSNEQQKADALSTTAASGTRTSSVQDSIDLQSAINNDILQAEKETNKKNNDFQLADILNSLANTNFGLQTQRTNAEDLRKSYEYGGTAWKQKQNANLATIAQAYWKNNQLNEKLSDTYDFGKNLYNVTMSAITGATSGMDTGYKLGDLYQNAIKPTYDTWAKLTNANNQRGYLNGVQVMKGGQYIN